MLFELRGVRKRYGERLALDLPALSLEQGKPVVFYGPNGSGKSTLLNLLALIDRPSEGEVRFSGGPREVTLAAQNPYLFRGSVLDNVVRGLLYRGRSRPESEAAALPLLKRLGLWELRARPGSALSEGERRKAALARAFVLGTKALLLDEPTANLDRSYCAEVEKLIAEEAVRPGRTVLMATHDLGQAFRMGADVVYLSEGRLSPVPLLNLYPCEIVPAEGEALGRAVLSPGCELFVATEASGRATVSVDPRDVLLSAEPIESSALNRLKGRVVSASALGSSVDVLVDAGFPLHAFITRRSLEKMNIHPGSEVHATFKASAARVL
ncbi:MAG TPA: hypothetical protein DCM05_15730 [Elusimicrobia bacterium]|nr:hypothetical protein [Elusimicrobiota bacterium]